MLKQFKKKVSLLSSNQPLIMNLKKLPYLILVIAISLTFFWACSTDDVTRPQKVYKVKYMVTSLMNKKSNFYITYRNPKYSNLVTEYFDTIGQWTFQFSGTTFDDLFLAAMTKSDSANMIVSIIVDDEEVAAAIDSCPTPLVCDTNYVAVKYVLP